MKKVAMYVLILVLITFCIPFFLTGVTVESSSLKGTVLQELNLEDNMDKNYLDVIDNTSYDYKDYNIIKLLHTKSNVIEEIKLDEYLYGVVSAEMPVDFELEALKAQAIVARTYTLHKIIENQSKHGEACICDDSKCCQAWITKEGRLDRWEEAKREENWNKIMLAVNSTKGKIITYNGKPINAFFHSNSGGATEAPENVWGGGEYPYLQTVQTSGEEGYEQYNSELEVSKEEFASKIKAKYSDFNINFDDENCIKTEEYTNGGRIKTIKIGNHKFSGVEIRTIFGLKSAHFDIQKDDNTIKFQVIGYGHGVGMSQTGADSLAKQGYNCEDIIKHFYVGVEVTNADV